MTATKSEYQSIPLKSLKLSDTNPRSAYDDKSLTELAASITQHGILQPLLARPHPKHKDQFEIISGSRRFKAATLAKLKEVPCRVKLDLTDEEVRAIQLVENLQRQDVPPLEEAEGIAELMKCKGYTVELIAEKIGKSASYVAKRMKLLELVPDAKKFLKAGILTQDHINLLARLTPDQQRETLEENSREWGDLVDIEPAAKMKLDIERRYFLDLSRAPWDKADANLVKKAGACTTCPKMAGNSKNLFDDVKKGDTCTDASCFDQKLTAFIQIIGTEEKMKAHKIADRWTDAEGVLPSHAYSVIKKTECENVAIGFYVTGDSIGKKVFICLRESGCKTHYGASSRNSSSGETAAQKEKRLASERERKHEIETRRKVLLEVEGMAPEGLTEVGELKLVAMALWNGCRRDTQTLLLKHRGWMPEKKKGESVDPPSAGIAQIEAMAEKTPLDLARFCVYMSLVDYMTEVPTDYDYKTDKRKPLPDLLMIQAKNYGIDLAKLSAPEEEKKPKAKAAKK